MNPGTANVVTLSAEELEEAQRRFEQAEPAEVLAWVQQRFGDQAVIASSFGVEDVALIDLASQHSPGLKVFTLDTGRLNPETYEVMEQMRNRYGLSLEVYAPDAGEVERLTREKGHFSFKRSIEDRKECCGIRKMEPLRRALSGRGAWVTGLRREQSPTRAEVKVVERDEGNGGIIKINPLAGWSESRLWAYVAERGVPYNVLHDRGFRSIGCAPCTRAIRPYEDVRAGRWWWESPDKKECGLHSPK